MSDIKMVRASTFYPQVINSIYESDKQLDSKSYEQQYQVLMDTLFGWANFWKLSADKIDNFDIIELVLNNERLQKTWAKDNKAFYEEKNWLLNILVKQLEHYQPNILFADDSSIFPNGFLTQLKKQIPSIQLIIGWDGLKHDNIELYAEYDVILTPVKDSVEFYKKNNKYSYFSPFGFETSILDKIDTSRQKQYDTSFVGSIFYAKDYHIKRFETLGHVASKIELNLWASSFINKSEKQQWQPYRYLQRQRLMQGKYKEWFYIWQLASINKGSVFGKEMYQTLFDSKITINQHIDVATKLAGNMRLYEATGIGTCLVTDWKENMHEFFKIDEEVVTYKTSQECVDKIKYLLKNEEHRNRIAKAAQKRTLENYSFERRVRDVYFYIKSII